MLWESSVLLCSHGRLYTEAKQIMSSKLPGSSSSSSLLSSLPGGSALGQLTIQDAIDLMHNCVMGVVTRFAWQANTNGGYAVKLLLFVGRGKEKEVRG